MAQYGLDRYGLGDGIPRGGGAPTPASLKKPSSVCPFGPPLAAAAVAQSPFAVDIKQEPGLPELTSMSSGSEDEDEEEEPSPPPKTAPATKNTGRAKGVTSSVKDAITKLAAASEERADKKAHHNKRAIFISDDEGDEEPPSLSKVFKIDKAAAAEEKPRRRRRAAKVPAEENLEDSCGEEKPEKAKAPKPNKGKGKVRKMSSVYGA